MPSLPRLFAVLFLGLATASAVPATDARFLDPELNRLLDDVEKTLQYDEKLKDMTVSLGLIASQRRPDSQFGPELRRRFEARLRDRLVPDGALTIVVTYDLTDSGTDTFSVGTERIPMRVTQITAKIMRGDQPMFDRSVEVNDTSDMAAIFGVPVAPPANGDQADRNRAFREAADRNKGKRASEVTPNYQVRGTTRIGIPGSDKFFVEVYVKDTPDGPATAVAPTTTPRGDAFVDIKPGQFYELVVHNDDEYDCVARILVDGQDAMNRFNADGVTYPGLLVQKQSSGRLRGWMHTAKPRGDKRDNVFAFAVSEYGHDSAAAVKATSDVGVITVQFAVAWKESEDRPAGRSIGRQTDKGDPLEQKFRVEKRFIGDFNETIAVRYSPTAR